MCGFTFLVWPTDVIFTFLVWPTDAKIALTRHLFSGDILQIGRRFGGAARAEGDAGGAEERVVQVLWCFGALY